MVHELPLLCPANRGAINTVCRLADIGLAVEGATGGVEAGRRTFANIMKYVRMSASSNFGNMPSMAVASIALPFLTMLPIQILLNNLLYDLSEVGIPFDKSGPKRPHGRRFGT